MIQIVNVSPEPKRFGIHQYEVRINGTLIVKFEHKREDGLSVCLLKAANAVEENRLEVAFERLKNTFDSVELEALFESVQPLQSRCKFCGGNDGDVPCAYPSEHKDGCLRDARLSSQPNGVDK